MAPWQASTVQEKQVRFIQEWQRDLLSFSALCQPANGEIKWRGQRV